MPQIPKGKHDPQNGGTRAQAQYSIQIPASSNTKGFGEIELIYIVQGNESSSIFYAMKERIREKNQHINGPSSHKKDKKKKPRDP